MIRVGVIGACGRMGLMVCRAVAEADDLALVAAIVVGWALAQRPELLPGLTADEAAAERPTLIATIGGVALGAVIVVPSLALLFGLVLRGRFDREATGPEVERRVRRVALRGRPLWGSRSSPLPSGFP